MTASKEPLLVASESALVLGDSRWATSGLEPVLPVGLARTASGLAASPNLRAFTAIRSMGAADPTNVLHLSAAHGVDIEIGFSLRRPGMLPWSAGIWLAIHWRKAEWLQTMTGHLSSVSFPFSVYQPSPPVLF